MKYVLIALIVQSASCNNFRSDLAWACRKSEQKVEECVANVFNNILLLLREGVPNYGIPVAEPFTVPLLEMNRKFNEHIEINVVMTNIATYGLTYGNISDLVLDSDTYNFRILYPKLLLNLDCKGRVIVSEILVKNEARVSLELRNVDILITMTMQPLRKNKPKHHVVSELNMRIDLEDAQLNAISKHPEEQSLANLALNLFNQNVKDFFVVLKPICAKVMAQFMRDGFNQVLSHIPASD